MVYVCFKYLYAIGVDDGSGRLTWRNTIPHVSISTKENIIIVFLLAHGISIEP